MVALAQDLIKRQVGKLEPADLEDRYESKLRAVIEAKLHGAGVAPEEEPAAASNVVDLLSALRRSLGQAPETAKAPKNTAPRKAARPAKKRA
jgi:DNA end-binding protein Ku